MLNEEVLLHILFIVNDWDQAMSRDFAAVDIRTRRFFRIHQQLGAYLSSCYFIESIDSGKLKQLYNSGVKCLLQIKSEHINDWASFTVALQDTETIKIARAEILPGCVI